MKRLIRVSDSFKVGDYPDGYSPPEGSVEGSGLTDGTYAFVSIPQSEIDAADAMKEQIRLSGSNLDNMEKTTKALGILMKNYTNALQAGTHTQKSNAQLKADFLAVWNALP